MGRVGFVYPTIPNVGNTARKPSWSMQSEIVMSCNHARWRGRFKLEEDDEEGSIAGEWGGCKPRPIVGFRGENSMVKSASAEEEVEEETA